jgi:nucleotide-binding universal stress UspA family protein
MLFQRILCPIDFSEFSTLAFRHAVSLAEHYRASLVALHVLEMWKYPYADYAAADGGDYANLRKSLHMGAKEHLHGFVKQHPHERIHPELAICEGRAADSILSFAQREKFDLIVMGTHGRRGFDRLVLGSTTNRVMRRACSPVLVVSHPEHNVMTTGPDGRHRLSRILYCTDFSINSDRAQQYAVSVAAEYDAELTMLHVTGSAEDLARAEAMIAQRTKELDKLISGTQPRRVDLRTAVRCGKPYEEIVDYAKEVQAHLVIMTARGGDAVDRAIFGSTTYRVIQLGPCPVLAIHT